MKNSVNNKTFDEIFAQRGEQVQPENMVTGEVYFYIEDSCASSCCIFKPVKLTKGEKIRVSKSSFYNGNFYKRDMLSYAEVGSVEIDPRFGVFYKATPDQIELLNSYRK